MDIESFGLFFCLGSWIAGTIANRAGNLLAEKGSLKNMLVRAAWIGALFIVIVFAIGRLSARVELLDQRLGLACVEIEMFWQKAM